MIVLDSYRQKNGDIVLPRRVYNWADTGAVEVQVRCEKCGAAGVFKSLRDAVEHGWGAEPYPRYPDDCELTFECLQRCRCPVHVVVRCPACYAKENAEAEAEWLKVTLREARPRAGGNA